MFNKFAILTLPEGNLPLGYTISSLSLPMSDRKILHSSRTCAIWRGKKKAKPREAVGVEGTTGTPDIYPAWWTNIAIEHGHWNSGFSHWKWWFSIAMLVHPIFTAENSGFPVTVSCQCIDILKVKRSTLRSNSDFEPEKSSINLPMCLSTFLSIHLSISLHGSVCVSMNLWHRV